MCRQRHLCRGIPQVREIVLIETTADLFLLIAITLSAFIAETDLPTYFDDLAHNRLIP